ncbi:DNA polymerase I [Taylorella equigenitalis]|uniref:DNA polymerase I n=1 Tax=Taylorella equigenitalis TaxID=29575 RepID=UPI000410CD9B|nr:DNA polymerase I [Taylorella equigenitalis]WDU47465.1 DNA polymerase I [Taylorella equigenitalis]
MKKTLLLVDGSSFLYRAHFAMPNLRSPDGEPSGAIFGLINMMKRTQIVSKPDYIACVFDAPGRTFRHELYTEYKSHRPPMPDDMRTQIEPIHQAIEALGWTIIMQSGVEADDIIATIADFAINQNIKCVIATSDKDIAQLVDDNISIITGKEEILDSNGVLEKYGVRPDQIIDYLMLMGDTSDNIPGVDKVGPKTATKWLNEFGSLENLLKNAGSLKGKVAQNLIEAQSQFDLTRKLVTIKKDCDISKWVKSIDDLLPKEKNFDVLKEIYTRFGFKTFLKDLESIDNLPTLQRKKDEEKVDIATEKTIKTNYVLVDTIDKLESCLEEIKQANLVALDTETNSLDQLKTRLVGISLSTDIGKAWYIPVAHQVELGCNQLMKAEVLEAMRSWLESEQKTKILQNAKYDMHVFANEGIVLKGIKHDTMVLAYVIDTNQRVGLEALSLKYLNRKGLSYEEICGKGAKAITFDYVPLDQATQYACEDADFTFHLLTELLPKLEGFEGLKFIYDLEMQVLQVLFDMERVGVLIDSSKLLSQSEIISCRLSKLESEIFNLAGEEFNINSPKQLSEILFTKLKLETQGKTRTGVISTNEDALEKLALDHPIAVHLLEYRSLSKLKSTYTDKLPTMINKVTGRVHTVFSQTTVLSGRLSSFDPNLQNIPIRNEDGRQVRQAFVAEDGFKLMSADYSQVELRLMAHISNDEGMLKAFKEGADIHRSTASEVFGVPLSEVDDSQRRAAKAINFGLIYGMGAFALANNLGISRETAQNYIYKYFDRFPKVRKFMDDIKIQASQDGYVETIYGRRIYIPGIQDSKGARKSALERVAINAPVQGSAADIIKMAMISVHKWISQNKLNSRIILQVHDELVLEVHESEIEILKLKLPKLMEDVAKLDVPLEAQVYVGSNWDEAH